MKEAKHNKKIILFAIGMVGLISAAGITYSAFVDKGEILGSTFSVGSADLKLLQDITGGVAEENLADDLAGPAFNAISPYWEQDYLVKLYNNGTSKMTLTSNADYLTENDPAEIRQIIFVEPFEWNDDGDGIVDASELGTSLGRKTIVKWKTEGFDLGELDTGQVKSLVLRFSTDTVSDSKQGAAALFDFEFNSTEVEESYGEPL